MTTLRMSRPGGALDEPLGSRRATAAVALGAAAIGISELAAIGILGLVADDLGVGVPAAGLIVSGYAVGVCLGGPLLAVATRGRRRHRVLLLALAVFVLTNLAIALAPILPVIIVLRVFSGAIHGLYVGLATAHAAALAPADRRGGAIALVFGGIAVATVLGAPAGRLLGEAAGWRAASWAVAAVTAVALAAVAALVPAAAGPATGTAPTARIALPRRMIMVLALIVLVLGAVFTFYTYVTEFLSERTGLTGPAISAALLAFGAASAAGTLIGGRLADRSAPATMIIAAGCVVGALLLLGLAGSWPVGAFLGLVLCGLAAFVYLPAFQLRLLGLAGPLTDLAGTLGASAANAGIAVGAVVGGAALTGGGTDLLLIIAGAAAVTGLGATWLTRRVA